ncbi:hypothetical protein OXPF_24110 [Oxobacter pfennigii]|uniref:N-terminal domain of peptidoglycan hydrolase CwlO-containing protein n=1 Tax=Oxobacter pfennigii TaxID=36849 RepID=A0A0P8YWZ0_9CLOT|nr:hypothetical protein [Oxobacter pfennigii]KPU44243.1 hypothetical protein OXPF_24110 [Oxobacter pfennigii]
MHNIEKIQIYIISFLIMFIFINFPLRIYAVPAFPSGSTQQKLQGISQEEKDILEDLFSLSNEIKMMEQEEKKLTLEINEFKKEAEKLESAILKEEKEYEIMLNSLSEVLKVYQRKGPGSFIEIILNSDSLDTMLWKLGTLRDLSRNTGNLLNTLKESREKLGAKKAVLDETLRNTEGMYINLKESLDNKLLLKGNLESYLLSLNEEREHYEEQLETFENSWQELKIMFSGIAYEFSRIIEEGRIPFDDIEVKLTLSGIEGIIEEEIFNDIAKEDDILSLMQLTFKNDRVEVYVQQLNLMLWGTFEVINGNTLNFKAQGGSFYGVALDSNALEDLFKEGQISLNLEPLIGKSRVQSLKINDGHLKFIIKPVF